MNTLQETAENDIYATGIVCDIEYDGRYIVIYFSEMVDGINGILINKVVNRGKSLKKALDKINDLLEKTSLMEG